MFPARKMSWKSIFIEFKLTEIEILCHIFLCYIYVDAMHDDVIQVSETNIKCNYIILNGIYFTKLKEVLSFFKFGVLTETQTGCYHTVISFFIDMEECTWITQLQYLFSTSEKDNIFSICIVIPDSPGKTLAGLNTKHCPWLHSYCLH